MTRRSRASGAPAARRNGGRLVAVIAIAVIGAVALGFAAYSALRPNDVAPLSAPVQPRYPDLTMGPLEDVTIGLREDGTVSVRFAATIVNVGEGDFLVHATRPHPFSGDWEVVQRVVDEDGLYSQRTTPATLVWGGDGHDHWHVRHVEGHSVETLDGEVLGEVVKAGFCFFDTDRIDTDLAGSPEERGYSARGCGGQLDMGADMGLSIGWGDKYPWQMLDQTVLVPELPDGRYVVRMVADPFDWFEEIDEANNEVATEIQVGTGADGARTVEVIGELQ